MCVCIHSYASQYRDAGWAKDIKKTGTAVHAMCQGNHSTCHRFASPVVVPRPKQYIYKNDTVSIIYAFMIYCSTSCITHISKYIRLGLPTQHSHTNLSHGTQDVF